MNDYKNLNKMSATRVSAKELKKIAKSRGKRAGDIRKAEDAGYKVDSFMGSKEKVYYAETKNMKRKAKELIASLPKDRGSSSWRESEDVGYAYVVTDDD